MDKWRIISDIADKYGLSGIQINPSVYKGQLGLSLNMLPNFFDRYRLTYHIGGTSTLVSEEDYTNLTGHISEALAVSAEFGVEDVSFHPPFINEETDITRNTSKEYLNKLLDF